MDIKIYFEDKPVCLCDVLSHELISLKEKNGTVYFDEIPDAHYFKTLHETIKSNEIDAVLIFNQDFKELKNVFFSHYKNIIACGGLIQNENKDVLFIFRRGKWDLPKGKMETDEALDECARREVGEETGVRDLIFKKKICETNHVYEENGRIILKTSHWFYFITSDKQNLKPQKEEDITKAEWIPTSAIAKPMRNTYATIKNVVHTFFDEP